MTSRTTSLRGDLASTSLAPSPGRPTSGRLGAAHAPWNDYLGSAAADDSGVVLGRRSLFEIASLDRERWTIVGIDLSLSNASEQVVLYAVDRWAKPANDEEVDEMAVTAVHLPPSTRVDEFLREAFERVSIRLMSTVAVDRYLRVDDHVQVSGIGE